MPPALAGETWFAACGTCITTQGGRNAWVATGGSSIARILATRAGGDTWNANDTPLVRSPGAGAISVAFRSPWNGIVGGGDPASNDSADAATSDDGVTWTLANKPPVQGAILCLACVRGVRDAGEGESGDQKLDRMVVITAEFQLRVCRLDCRRRPERGLRLPKSVDSGA